MNEKGFWIHVSSTSETFYHSLYRGGIGAKQFQNHAGSPDAKAVKEYQRKNQRDSEQNAGDKPSDVAAFVGSQPLQKSVND